MGFQCLTPRFEKNNDCGRVGDFDLRAIFIIFLAVFERLV